ncbi:hypothetical protein FQR65_LT18121 [Abscondita terminalis]|nr:hypothetical protein FQR65_LT18121 [Abscondita terminalis]
MIHGQMLRLGERLYGDEKIGMQYSFLRAEPKQPSCDRNLDIDKLVKEKMQQEASDPDAAFFGLTPEADVRASFVSAQTDCEQKYAFYDKSMKHMEDHPSIRTYRSMETGFFWILKWGSEHRVLILILMVVIAAITASLKMHHIGLRPARTKLDFKVYNVAMVLGNALLSFSVISQYRSVQNSGVESTLETIGVYWLWMILFTVLTVISLYKLFRTPETAEEGGNFGLALLSIPLYAFMAIVTGIAFTFFMDYPMGQGIYLGLLTEFSNIFLNLALFIWAGMLLTQTRVMDLFLAILRPWNLAPETLTWIILIGAAIPTAYTGASGIFVVAAGAIIYKEPAMSVHWVCRHVTSDELFDHGIYVFWLTAFIFLGVSLFLAENKFRINSPKVAVPAAPCLFLPIMLLAFILFDKLFGNKLPIPENPNKALALEHEKNSEYLREHGDTAETKRGFRSAIRFATSESVGHIGALIILMALSASVGGLIERSEIVTMVPTHLGSILVTLGFMALLLAMIGMTTDPFGAVILVAATIAPVAFDNGIHPIHFWMIVLVAFEFGYVTPPVALNHLLTRLSVGDAEVAAADAEAKAKYTSFYYRYERWILPIVVLFSALMIVTYAPYLFNLFDWYSAK